MTCSRQISCKVDLCGRDMEILFLVIPDKFSNSDIPIGRDLLSLGFSVEVSSDKLNIKKSASVICGASNAFKISDCTHGGVSHGFRPHLFN